MDFKIITKLFSQRIKFLRKRKGYSQEGFARICRVNRAYYGEIERGKKNPSLQILVLFAQTLDMSLKDLFDFEEDSPNIE